MFELAMDLELGLVVGTGIQSGAPEPCRPSEPAPEHTLCDGILTNSNITTRVSITRNTTKAS
jgi:hypothetical protein